MLRKIIIGLLIIGFIVWLYPYIQAIQQVVASSKIQIKSVEILKSIDLPKNLKEKVVVYGNPSSNRILISAQGGPTTELDVLELQNILHKSGKINQNDFLVVDVHQCQTLRAEDMENREISFDEARKCDKKTVKTIADTIKYFKSKDKTVYVLGISFGAFVVEDLIATYGNTADKYLIMVGRLNMPDDVWKEFAKGIYVGFEYDKDGKKNVIKFNAEQAGMGGGDSIEDKNMAKIAAGLGYKRYIELLKNKKLDNVTFVYGNRDEQVGSLPEKTIEFLKSKGVKVYEMDGQHSDVIDEFSKKYLTEIFK